MKKARLIYNQKAGESKDNREPSIEEIREAIEKHGFSVELAPTEQPGDGKRLSREATDMDTVFILGGDGTVHECINGLAEQKQEQPPSAAILPGGTCNDFARTLGIPLDLIEAVDALCSGSTRNVDVPKINDNHFLNFLAVGLIADTSENIDADLKRATGRLSYFWSALQTTLQPVQYSYEIATESEKLEGEAVLILVANGNYIGSVTLPREHDINDGYLHMYIVKEAGLSLINAWREARLDEEFQEGENLIYRKVQQLTLNVNPKGNIDVDGEDGGKPPVEIVTGKKLRFHFPI
ncbi:diacylglycerol kinase family protein [Geomicrobium sp. JSM 1781026]|uniref:diacylglycerol/lipid kinase family protein n=1 Tax=Geomicrobium sp. JSM 1781026 TaxID=3344580 RepID=UPI0035BEB84C